MALHVYNTLTRTKEKFEPVNPELVGFYVCGPTVYDYFHIGNARPMIVFDVFRRYLIYRGYNVRYVTNLTDIDDKIIRRAAEQGVSSRDIAQKFIAAFFEDSQKLGVRPADVYPRATDHIADMIELIGKLVDDGFAYASGGDVFFDVRKFSDYAALSGKKLEELRSGARISVDERKKDPLDFVLWKASKPDEPSWQSPWGAGRPGWHIECSAMSMKYLGQSFDFHAGGLDLIFPHHENEIAQSEAATGRKFARYWLHNGFLDISGEKMAKSTGNFFTAREVLQRYSAAAIRLFFLQKHYRGPIDFTDEALQSAETSVGRLSASFAKFTGLVQEVPAQQSPPATENERQQSFLTQAEKLGEELLAAMDDDFNTPAALARVFDLVRETNRFVDDGVESDSDRRVLAWVVRQLTAYDGFFGVVDSGAAVAKQGHIDEVIENILALRQEMRREKNFALADRLRDTLTTAGVIVEDSPQGISWRWKN